MNLKIFPLLCLVLISQQALAQPNKEINEKLSIITSLSVNDEYIDLPEDSILRKYLKIELITEDQFLAKRKTRVNWLVADTLKIRKKKGVLRLPTSYGSKAFTDKLVDDDGREEYDYLGNIAFLGVYLVRTMLWEDINYDLISKKSGKSIGVFSSIPYVSPDKKKIVSVYADPYETDSEIAVFSITNGKINNYIYARFKNWMPGDENKIFWGTDGKLYLPVQYSDKYWNENGNYNTDYQYIRVSLL
jgi:hypothetical protein